MAGLKRFQDTYLRFSENILIKLRYKVNAYDEKSCKWLMMELLLLIVYHVFSLIKMGTPTPVSLYLNTALVFRFIIGNHRENRKIVNKAKKSKKASKNEYTSMHEMIAIGELIAAGLMVIMIFWLGVDNNIGQIQLATCVIVCISFLESWKDISVSFFDATPKVF
ncbi:MAG: hypothetical protein NC321_16715 [Clostridium sp.]|nr:hypothetical protein [Clostridium sp.]